MKYVIFSVQSYEPLLFPTVLDRDLKTDSSSVGEQFGNLHTVTAAAHNGIIPKLLKARFGQPAEALHHLCSLVYL